MNIVMISSDSHDGRILQSLGYPAALTPNMDRLAAGGTTFAEAYCSSPQCVPSRASMWSGRQVHEIPAWNNYTGLAPNDPTFLSVLEQAGYACATFGKTDYLGGAHAEQNRLAAWIRSRGLGLVEKRGPRLIVDDDHELRSQQMVRHWGKVDQACDWLVEHAGAEPLCCYVGVNPPHPGGGYHTNRYWWNRIDEASMNQPPSAPCQHPAMAYMRRTKGAEIDLTEAQIAGIRRAYLARIAEVDAMVGQVLDTLDRLGMSEETLVVYLSDHGDLHLEHGQYLKNALFEGSVRVPLIMRQPGGVPGQQIQVPVSLLDVLPTLLELAGLPVPATTRGRSLASGLSGTTPAQRDIFAEYHSNFQQVSSFMLRRGPWKLIHFDGHDPMLFNLEDDPDEVADCAAMHPALVSDLARGLAAICDPAAVSNRVRADDRRHLHHWMHQANAKPWRQRFREHFPDCSDDDLECLSQWAEKPLGEDHAVADYD